MPDSDAPRNGTKARLDQAADNDRELFKRTREIEVTVAKLGERIERAIDEATGCRGDVKDLKGAIEAREAQKVSLGRGLQGTLITVCGGVIVALIYGVVQILTSGAAAVPH